jgi:hypothetical protein
MKRNRITRYDYINNSCTFLIKRIKALKPCIGGGLLVFFYNNRSIVPAKTKCIA